MIRFAQIQESNIVAPLMFQAMEEIVYKIIGKVDKQEGISFLKKLFEQKNNQYSYENTFVFEENNQILGSLVFYDGARLDKLRKPVLQLAKTLYQNEVILEDETQSGEIYIDTLSVLTQAQGKGVGTALIKYLQEYAKKHFQQNVGLLVEENNFQAEKLYSRLGFLYQSTKPLAGGNYKHLVYVNFP